MKSLVFSSLTAVRQGRKGYGIRYQPSTAKVRYARSASCLRHIAYSDFWEADHRVLPSKRHRAVGKESGQTNHIERFNCTLGQRISPLVRKTLSFSKKLENHIGAIGVLCSPLQCILTCLALPGNTNQEILSQTIAASSKVFTTFEKRRRRGTRKLYLGSSLVIAVLIVCHQGSMGWK